MLVRLEGMDKHANECAERVWAAFLAAMDELPAPTRAVFLMHTMFEAGSEDIERATGVRREECPAHLDSARRAMRDAIR